MSTNTLSKYRLLGRSGLRVSPLCLGTMTFGTDWGFGSEEAVSRQVFFKYLEAGGNFIDTADGYTAGNSERMIGKFLKEWGQREKAVIATKFTFSADPNDINAGGNSRKNLMRALEGSLKRLQLDYIDMYWVHAWDKFTPVEEVMRALDDAVTSGKIRYVGFSNVPAWWLGRAQALAENHGWTKGIGLQYEYSLVERNIEREFVPAALEMGLGLTPWSPLASGLLSGKYKRGQTSGEGRLIATKDAPNPVFKKFNERNFSIVDVLVQVAKELGHSPAQVALNWVANRPGVTSTIIGATKLSQLEDNLQALEFNIPEKHSQKLEAASAPESQYPYMFFEKDIQSIINVGSLERGPR